MSSQVAKDEDAPGKDWKLVNFRCPRELLEAFEAAARAQDTDTSKLLRKLMRDYVAAVDPKPKR